MATPITVTNGVDANDAAVFNKYVTSDGTLLSVKMWHGRAQFNGADTVLHATTDAAGFTSPSTVFNVGNTEFDFTLSGFTNPPVATLTPFGNTAYTVKVVTMSTVLCSVAFYNIDTGAKIVTGTEDTNMDFNIILIGS